MFQTMMNDIFQELIIEGVMVVYLQVLYLLMPVDLRVEL